MHHPSFHGLIATLVTALAAAYRTEDETTLFAAMDEADRAFGALLRLVSDRAGLRR